MNALIREYLEALPDALAACDVLEYRVKLVGRCTEITVVKRDGVSRIYTLDPENVEDYQELLKDWWALMRAEA